MEINTKKKLVLTGTALVIVLAAYGVYWFLTRDKETAEGDFSNSTSRRTSKPKVFPLRKGSKGEEVKKLQKALNQKLLPPIRQLVVDGIFGSKTLGALKSITGKSTVNKSEYSKLIQSVFPF